MKRIHVILSDELYKDVKDYCQTNRFEQSEFIRSCIRERIIFQNPKLPRIKLENAKQEAEQVERKVEEVKQKTAQLLKSPIRRVFNKFEICSKHGGFKSSCGCE